MPLSLANYSVGIIVTDWFASEGSVDESVKISVRFLSNEIRSDALSIKVFYVCFTTKSLFDFNDDNKSKLELN